MSLKEKFALLIEAAQTSVAYWRDIAITDFTRDLHARMQTKGISHAELANRMGTSRPYVTKLLNGGNFTLETMVKLAMALNGVIRVHIADHEAITHWKDEYIGQSDSAMVHDFEAIRGFASGAIPMRTTVASLTDTAQPARQPTSDALITSAPRGGGRHLLSQESFKDPGSGEAQSL